MTDSNPKLVEVYRNSSLPAAHNMRMELEAEGLQVFMDGELLQGGLGDLPLGWATAVRILVAESHAEIAKSTIERIEARILEAAQESPPQGESCLACGHAMKENEIRCPACGWTFLDTPQPISRDD